MTVTVLSQQDLAFTVKECDVIARNLYRQGRTLVGNSTVLADSDGGLDLLWLHCNGETLFIIRIVRAGLVDSYYGRAKECNLSGPVISLLGIAKGRYACQSKE